MSDIETFDIEAEADRRWPICDGLENDQIDLNQQARSCFIAGYRFALSLISSKRDLDAERSPEAKEWRRRRRIGMPQ